MASGDWCRLAWFDPSALKRGDGIKLMPHVESLGTGPGIKTNWPCSSFTVSACGPRSIYSGAKSLATLGCAEYSAAAPSVTSVPLVSPFAAAPLVVNGSCQVTSSLPSPGVKSRIGGHSPWSGRSGRGVGEPNRKGSPAVSFGPGAARFLFQRKWGAHSHAATRRNSPPLAQPARQGSSLQSGMLIHLGPPRPRLSSALGMVWMRIPASSRERLVT